jgi:hypothetical protein
MVATTSASLDWKQFEQTLFSIYWQDAQAFLAANPQESIYALALNGLYREEDGPIYLPTLSANSEQAYSQMVNAPSRRALVRIRPGYRPVGQSALEPAGLGMGRAGFDLGLSGVGATGASLAGRGQ